MLLIRIAKIAALVLLPLTFHLSAEESAYDLVQRSQELVRAGKYDRAENALRSSLSLLVNTGPGRFVATANLAATLYYRGKFVEAESAFRNALEIWLQSPAPSRLDAFPVLNNLTILYLQTGQFAAAEKTAMSTLAYREKIYGPNSSSVAVVLNNLAGAYYGEGQYDKAEPAARRSVQILSIIVSDSQANRAAGDPVRTQLAASLEQLAVVEQKRGKLREADALLTRAKKMCESLPDPKHLELAEMYAATGALRIEQKKYRESKLLLQRAIDIWRESNSGNLPQFARTLNNLSQVYKLTGDFQSAETVYREAITLCDRTLGDQHPTCATFSANYGDLLAREGRFVAAKQVYEQVLPVLAARLGPDHPEVVHFRKQLSSLENLPSNASNWTIALHDLQRSPKR